MPANKISANDRLTLRECGKGTTVGEVEIPYSAAVSRLAARAVEQASSRCGLVATAETVIEEVTSEYVMGGWLDVQPYDLTHQLIDTSCELEDCGDCPARSYFKEQVGWLPRLSEVVSRQVNEATRPAREEVRATVAVIQGEADGRISAIQATADREIAAVRDAAQPEIDGITAETRLKTLALFGLEKLL